MIIQCQKCKSEFNIDERLVKEGGSKVRCSVCKDVFIVRPPKKPPIEEIPPVQPVEEELEETTALDAFADLEEKEPETIEEAIEASFDKAFEEALEEGTDREVAAAKPSDFVEELEAGEAVERPPRREEEVAWKAEKEIPQKTQEVVKPGEIARPEVEAGRRLVFPIILLVILVLLGGAASVFFWAPDLIPDSLSFLKPTTKQELTDIGVRRLSFKAVTGSFAESDKAGQLFVVKGMVTNNYPKRRSFILVKGAILDDKGQVVRRKMAYAGNIFREEQLKTMSVEEVNKSGKNRFGKGRVNYNIEPGSSIPFMIIFDNLPENMSEFTVEAVRSSLAE